MHSADRYRMPLRVTANGCAGVYPLRCGVPWPQGVLQSPNRVVLAAVDGQELPVQATPLAHWPDGSIKWLLLDAVAELPTGGADFQVSAGEPGAIAHPVSAFIDGDDGCLSGDHLTVRVSGQGRLTVAVSADADGSLSTLTLVDADGTERVAQVSRVTVASDGPVCATLEVHGGIPGTALSFVCRIDIYAGLPALSVALTLHNPRAAQHENGLWDLGDAGSVNFRSVTWRTTTTSTDENSGNCQWRLQPEGPIRQGPACIHQASSGGENWDSLNHMDRDGRVNLPFCGYRVSADAGLLAEGKRCQPAVSVDASGQKVALALEQFWQHFPKGLEAGGGGIALELFPQDDTGGHEIQGGERTTHHLWMGVGDNALDDVARLAQGVALCHDPQALAASDAIPLLQPEGGDAAYTAAVAPAAHGERSFVARRELIDEYGWRNFGDLYADHEQQFYTGDAPLISHYNNQYDVIYGLLIQYLRSGDPAWWQPAADLARHVMDIDIYHTADDRPAYNGGLFWHTDHYEHAASASHRTYSKQSLRGRSADQYGGGPANEHAYSSGLLLFYYLTGDPDAKDAVIGFGDWIIAMDDGTGTVLGWVDDGPTGAASRTCEVEYHGPGRGAGNAINVLLDAATVTGKVAYQRQAEQLMRRTIHPGDDLAALELNNPELRWSYTVYLQVLGRYLLYKEGRGERDADYDYGVRSLSHYAAWMVANEVPYLSQPERLEYPTETWAAQEIRKACVLDLAARYQDAATAKVWHQKAEFFFDDALTRLKSFTTHDATRPLAILMSCGWQRAYFADHGEDVVPALDRHFDHGVPSRFISQKRRVLGWMKSPSGWPRLALGFLKNAPKKWRAGK